MSSVREALIQAVVARFKTITTANGYATAIGTKVYPWRKTPLAVSELPAILVWDQGAEMSRETLRNTTGHTLSFTAALYVHGKTTASQAREGLNDMFKAIWTDPLFSGLATQYIPKNHDLTMEVDGDICGAGHIQFDLVYYTATPGTI